MKKFLPLAALVLLSVHVASNAQEAPIAHSILEEVAECRSGRDLMADLTAERGRVGAEYERLQALGQPVAGPDQQLDLIDERMRNIHHEVAECASLAAYSDRVRGIPSEMAAECLQTAKSFHSATSRIMEADKNISLMKATVTSDLRVISTSIFGSVMANDQVRERIDETRQLISLYEKQREDIAVARDMELKALSTGCPAPHL